MKYLHATRAFSKNALLSLVDCLAQINRLSQVNRLTMREVFTAIVAMIAVVTTHSVNAEQLSVPTQETVISEPEQENANAALIEAKRVLEQARELAEQIVADANAKAKGVKEQDEPLSQLEQDAQILTLRNAKVSVELQAGTVEEITRAIMPAHWRVMFDVKDPGLKQRRFQYISTKPREQALNDLLRPLGMQHQYFYELQDENGNSSPLLVVSQR